MEATLRMRGDQHSGTLGHPQLESKGRVYWAWRPRAARNLSDRTERQLPMCDATIAVITIDACRTSNRI